MKRHPLPSLRSPGRVLALLAWAQPRTASALESASVQLASSLATSAPWDRAVSRYITRAENSGERLALSMSAVAATWLWIGVSLLAYVAVVPLAAAADVHMLRLFRKGARELATYLFRAERTFFRVFRDRQTPHFARLVLLAGLAYWLVPVDLVADTPFFPGFVDDMVMAIVSARLFLRLCPDGVVAKHATQVQSAGEA